MKTLITIILIAIQITLIFLGIKYIFDGKIRIGAFLLVLNISGLIINTLNLMEEWN